MEDSKRKTELARSLAISASSESLIRSYLDRSTMLFSVVITPAEIKAKEVEVQKAFDDATNDILEHIVKTVENDFTLEELEKLDSMMNDPLFSRFNNFWKDEKSTNVLIAIANERAIKLVKELNLMFPAPGVPATKEPPKDKLQLN